MSVVENFECVLDFVLKLVMYCWEFFVVNLV